VSNKPFVTEVQVALIQTYVPESADLGLSFNEALTLACQRDDAVASSLELQAKDLGLEPRKV
jgi:hypothetical protein